MEKQVAHKRMTCKSRRSYIDTVFAWQILMDELDPHRDPDNYNTGVFIYFSSQMSSLWLDIIIELYSYVSYLSVSRDVFWASVCYNG